MQSILNGLRALPVRYLMAGILLLCIPAFLVNLNIAAFIGDEAIRAWVALEMDISGNYFATTMHGAPYINKPPLFNWLILVATKLWGSFDEMPSRLITVFFLAVFGWTIFRSVRRHFSPEFAFLAAITTLTSGRILFYDSMLGLIDTTFSWVMYLLFMTVYFFGRKEQWLRLFVSSYLLMATGFLLKGFPAIVFLGLTLAAALFFFNRLRLLFSWKHLAGMCAGAAMLGLYLAVYAQYRPLEELIPNLLHESVKRTAVQRSPLESIAHLFTFPFESVYHFLPFSLLLLFWLNKNLWQRIRSNPFVYYNFIILAANLPVYWTSSQVVPRYLLMFIPLFNVIGLYLMEQEDPERSWRFRSFYYLLGGILAISPIAVAATPFLVDVHLWPMVRPLSIGLALALGLFAVLYFTDKQRFMWWFVAALLVIRIGFDLIVLPIRHHENDISIARRDAIDMAVKHGDRHWYVYADSETREPAMFYATARLGYIVERTNDTGIPNALYLVNLRQYPHFQGRCLDTLRTDYKTTTLGLFVRE